MVTVVCIGRDCSIKQANHKSGKNEDLFRRAGLRVGTAFDKRAEWPGGSFTIEVWAKNKGRAGSENKYDMPPPIDTDLLFGTCVVTARGPDGALVDMSHAEWTAAYDRLMGGFEDVGSDSVESVEDIVGRAENGYELDDFVVEDELEVEEYV